MVDPHGRFIWHELLTNDTASAAKFYANVVGWNLGALEADGIKYTIMQAGLQPVAALADAGPGALDDRKLRGWIAYALVEDVDATADTLVRLGGTLPEPPSETSGIGRFAVATDPQGALIGLFAPAPGNSNPEQGDPSAPGKATWHELYTDDLDAVFSVYAEAFGWEKDTAFDMGPAGPYQLIALGGQPMGGMMLRPSQLPKPYWNTFFEVDDITLAERRVKASGGTVFDGPREVAGGGFTLKCFDLEGVMFALSGKR